MRLYDQSQKQIIHSTILKSIYLCHQNVAINKRVLRWWYPRHKECKNLKKTNNEPSIILKNQPRQITEIIILSRRLLNRRLQPQSLSLPLPNRLLQNLLKRYELNI
jgi:hypothetical protein